MLVIQNYLPKDIARLKEESLPLECEIITISTLSNELFNNFPTITKEFLNIEIDTLQILDYKDFIKSYDNNKFSTPLDLPFLLDFLQNLFFNHHISVKINQSTNQINS